MGAAVFALLVPSEQVDWTRETLERHHRRVVIGSQHETRYTPASLPLSSCRCNVLTGVNSYSHRHEISGPRCASCAR